MASTYIDIKSGASRQAQEVRNAIDTLASVQNQFDEIKAMFDQMAMGGDYTTLKAYLGVATEADAEAVYNLWGSATTELHATFISQLLARCG